jgi:hypothetical protein
MEENMQENGRLRGRIGRALALLGMIEAARTQGMDAADLGLLAVLASHADDGGAAHPSQSTLAREVGRERPWVNRRLAALADADLGGGKALEKARRRLAKGGETSCVYRLPIMDLAVVVAAAAPDSKGDTPCSRMNHEQEESHDQHSLSPGADAPESAGEGIGLRDEVDTGTLGAGWVPSPEDIADAAVTRPDLTPEDLLLLGEKLVARHGGRLSLADASAVFRRWVLTERACRHAPDHDHDHDHHRPRSRQYACRAIGPADGLHTARAANRDKALAALALLAG